MKKIFSIVLALCLVTNISFAAFDPYADEEVEKKSYNKLYYGIALTLIGGFLAYDGFSKVEVDVSKPSVDYTTVLQSEWNQISENHEYELRSGYSLRKYTHEGKEVEIQENIIYNNGNVDLNNIVIEVRYKNAAGYIAKDEYGIEHPDNGPETSDGYHVAKFKEGDPYSGITLAKGQSLTWKDLWVYRTDLSSPPYGSQRSSDETIDDPEGLLLGEKAFDLIDIRVKLKKNQQYKPIYEKRNKCDAEGVAGILVGITGIYFIVDHFLDMHKFNAYAKRHHLNLRLATASNEYKLMLQKRI